MRAFIVVDLGYGDSGKGTTVDYLVRRHNIGTVVRFNGGPQAGHNVVLPDGRHHEFAQWGAGTFAGARTYMSEWTMVNPLNAYREAEHLLTVGISNPFNLVSVNSYAKVITPFHAAANKIREQARGEAAHGSCGQGIGEAVQDALAGYRLYVRELEGKNLSNRLKDIRDRKVVELERDLGSSAVTNSIHRKEFSAEVIQYISLLYKEYYHKVQVVDNFDYSAGDLVFEGAQGVLLDETHGYHPHTTWSDCTFNNALSLLHGYDQEIISLGVTRTYMTRHGNGPLATEDNDDLPFSLGERHEPHNHDHGFQGRFRVGFADFGAWKYAIDACGGPKLMSGLVLTHADRGLPGSKYSKMYDGLGRPVYKNWYGIRDDLRKLWEQQLDVPVVIQSSGPTWKHKTEFIRAHVGN